MAEFILVPFCFKRKESVRKAVRRICRERVHEALKCLRHTNHLECVHEVRKEIKKLRAILRLIRGEIGKGIYRRNTNALRTAANHLTAIRDAHVTLNAFEKLTHHFARKLPARPLPEIKKALRKNCRRRERKFLKGNSVPAVRKILQAFRGRGRNLKIESDGWAAICPGLKQSYCRGKNALKTVGKNPSPENFHEWRKRVKDLWHQIKLLCPAWPQELRAAADELESLGEFLGDDHDLVMLKKFLADACGKIEGAKLLNELIELRQKELRSAGLKLGVKFFAEKPVAFCRRFENYWKIWRSEK
ncbi:MAG TPA: CHAD domain-containing protein [Verrucomicrobiae bacterium]